MQTPTNFVKHTSANPLRKILLNNFYKMLINEIKILKPNSILDAGCGEGFTLQKIQDLHIGAKLEGVDNSKEAVLLAKRYFPDLSIKEGSIYDLPYQKNTFDLVISTEVLEHLEDPKKALQELVRVSKKYILISVPNEPWFRISRLLSGINIRNLGDHPEHINHWGVRSLRKFLSKYCKILTVKLPFPWILVLLEKQ